VWIVEKVENLKNVNLPGQGVETTHEGIAHLGAARSNQSESLCLEFFNG